VEMAFDMQTRNPTISRIPPPNSKAMAIRSR
jgi:hypothetical protein